MRDPSRVPETMQAARIGTGEAAFSIVEVVIGMSILLVGLLAIGAMQMRAVEVNKAGRMLTEATSLGQDRIEALLAADYGTVAGSGNPVTTPDGRFTISWTVVDDTPVVNSKLITVTVAWSREGTQQQVRLSSVRANL